MMTKQMRRTGAAEKEWNRHIYDEEYHGMIREGGIEKSTES